MGNATNFERFVEGLKDDLELAQKVQSIGQNLEAIIQLGKKNGYEFTAEDIQAYNEQNGSDELSDEELDSVAGGAVLIGSATLAMSPSSWSHLPQEF